MSGAAHAGPVRRAARFVASAAALACFVGTGLGLGFGSRSAGAAETLVTFQSPTGNAHCVIYTAPGEAHFATCELREFAGKAPKAPADCDLDWVPGASVDARGRVTVFSCQGDTNQNPRNRKLAYGKSLTSGEFTCASSAAGVTCKVKSGRGFLVSRTVIRKL